MKLTKNNLNNIKICCLHLIILLYLVSGMFIQHSIAGDAAHGGSAVVTKVKGAVTHAEVLDTWEASIPIPFGPGLKITIDKKTSVANQFLDFIDTLAVGNKKFAKEVQDKYLLIKTQVMDLKDFEIKTGFSLKLADLKDTDHVFEPANGREVLYAMHYRELPGIGKKLIKKDNIWNVYDNTNKAIAWLHEAVADVLRDYMPELVSTKRARRIVGHAAAGFIFEDIHSGIPNDAYYCKNKYKNGDRLYLFPNAKNDGLTIQLIHKKGSPIISKRTFNVPHSKITPDIYKNDPRSYRIAYISFDSQSKFENDSLYTGNSGEVVFDYVRTNGVHSEGERTVELFFQGSRDSLLPVNNAGIMKWNVVRCFDSKGKRLTTNRLNAILNP